MPIIRSMLIRRTRNLIACVIIMCCSLFYIVYNSAFPQNVLSLDIKSQAELYEYIPSGCGCKNEETNFVHNFCYRLPSNLSILGRPFSCNYVKQAARLGLLDLEPTKFVQIESYSKNDRGFPDPIFVTAASDSHYAEALVLIATLQQNMPMQKIIFYDLGLNETQMKELTRLCNVEHRKFPYELYPNHVKNMTEYRWKPLIIAQTLNEFGAVWYMDSSVVFRKGNLSHVYGLFECRRHMAVGAPLRWKSPHYLVGLPKNDPTWIETGFHEDRYKTATELCYKFAYMLQGYTGHGIFSATHPDVYAYIPTDEKQLKEKWAKMYEAGFVFAVRTIEVVQDVLKWYVLCALEEHCMSPANSSLKYFRYVLCALEEHCMSPANSSLRCSFGTDRFGTYAGCHRFDQSIINLLLANRNNYDSLYWTSGIVDYFNIIRGARYVGPPKFCL